MVFRVDHKVIIDLVRVDSKYGIRHSVPEYHISFGIKDNDIFIRSDNNKRLDFKYIA
jgi:hypothetical protein